jgi:hypothetical protein
VFKRFVIVALVAAVLAPAERAFAQAGPTPADRLAMPAAGPLSTAVARVRFDSVGDSRAGATAQRSIARPAAPKNNVAGKVVMATLGGVGGFFGGGYVGAKLEGPCSCDDPGLKGAIIGAPIGAIVGAVVGWKVAGLF